MGIRIRPAEVEIPDDCPFQNDLLDRKKPAEVLTQLVDGIDGPCVLAIDAPWGAGKTTFLKMWSRDLRNEGSLSSSSTLGRPTMQKIPS